MVSTASPRRNVRPAWRRAFASFLAWLSENVVPLLLLPLAALLLWIAIWRIWLPADEGRTGVVRTVTTTQRSGSATAGGAVVAIERATSVAAPSRRSETLVVVLLLLAVGSAGVGLFHRRLISVDVGPDGFKITLTHNEKQALAGLVETLHAANAPAGKVALGVQSYLDAISGLHTLNRPPVTPRSRFRTARHADSTAAGLSLDETTMIAESVAAELL